MYPESQLPALRLGQSPVQLIAGGLASDFARNGLIDGDTHTDVSPGRLTRLSTCQKRTGVSCMVARAVSVGSSMMLSQAAENAMMRSLDVFERGECLQRAWKSRPSYGRLPTPA